MDVDEIVRALRCVQEKHRNDRLLTFQTDVSAMARDAADMIESLQAQLNDVVPVVRGEWTYEINEYFRTCSVCRISQALLAGENLSRFKYCPFCGAKMEDKHK